MPNKTLKLKSARKKNHSERTKYGGLFSKSGNRLSELELSIKTSINDVEKFKKNMNQNVESLKQNMNRFIIRQNKLNTHITSELKYIISQLNRQRLKTKFAEKDKLREEEDKLHEEEALRDGASPDEPSAQVSSAPALLQSSPFEEAIAARRRAVDGKR